MNKLFFIVLLDIFTTNSFAYGDLSANLPKNFCQDICQSQKPQKYLITSKVDLVGQDITCIDFTGTDLQEADLTNALALCTNFTKANLAGANLTNTNVLGANFTEANLALAKAASPFSKTNPDADIVTNYLHVNCETWLGLFFHGRDLSKGSFSKDTIKFVVADGEPRFPPLYLY